MEKIFVKDDRLRKIHSDLGDKITELMNTGELKGSYTIKEETKGFEDGIYFGWEVTDHEDGWKIDDLDDFVITIKKDKVYGNYYFAICEQFFTENVIASHMGCGKTVEGALLDFVKELKAQRKTLCVRGKAIEGKVAEAIYKDGEE